MYVCTMYVVHECAHSSFMYEKSMISYSSLLDYLCTCSTCISLYRICDVHFVSADESHQIIRSFYLPPKGIYLLAKP